MAVEARAEFPEQVVAAFCEADGRGDRLQPARAAAIGEALGWRLEPAWDRLFLISGYEVMPLRVGAEAAEIAVRYTVVAEVTGEGARDEERIEVVSFRLVRGDQLWRLVGVPPPPHLFASAFERDDLVELLTPLGADYLSSSKLVWRLFQNAGWSVPYQPAAAFLAGGYFKKVAEPSPGDVVAYLDHGAPYHVGVYEGEDRIASATITAGVVRTPLNTFPGEVRYLRLTEAARPTPTSAPALDSTPPSG
jgi:hypothetical protein